MLKAKIKAFFKDTHQLYILLFTFVFGAFIGWLLETIFVSIMAGHLVDRGFLIGPLCPIYGFGALFLRLFLGVPRKGFKAKFYYFLSASGLLGALELVSGLLINWLLHCDLWNYRDKPFNILGYVTIPTALMWGILALLFGTFVLPVFEKIANIIPENKRKLVVTIFFIIFSIDLAAGLVRMVVNPSFFNDMVHPF